MIYNKADKISCFTLPIRNQHKMSLYHYYTIKAYFCCAYLLIIPVETLKDQNN
jgi:hypothetical protein